MSETPPRIAPTPAVSIVVVAYNMHRELPRTLASLSRRMQQGLDGIDYEIIIVDNGSDPPVQIADDPEIVVVRIPDAKQSPCAAINRAIAMCRSDIIGVCIDGARIASPGLVRHALLAVRLHSRPVISTLGFHLGPDVQMRSVAAGYDQTREDALLAASGWELDGYQLFAISTLAASSGDGWFMPIAESNALFLHRSMWAELGGYDERFVSPGGGFANLDMYERACSLPGSQVIVLLGEATFHQVHGGVATNALVSPGKDFQREYRSIRAKDFQRPHVDPLYLGHLRPQVGPSLAFSALRLVDASGVVADGRTGTL